MSDDSVVHLVRDVAAYRDRPGPPLVRGRGQQLHRPDPLDHTRPAVAALAFDARNVDDLVGGRLDVDRHVCGRRNLLTEAAPEGRDRIEVLLPDADKPLDCGRIAYTTSVTCAFNVRNGTQAPLAVLVGIIPGSVGSAFRVTAPTTPPASAIAPNATLAISVTFTPPPMPASEWMFMVGILVFSQAAQAQAGRTACGVGFGQQEAPPTPPPSPAPALLTCP